MGKDVCHRLRFSVTRHRSVCSLTDQPGSFSKLDYEPNYWLWHYSRLCLCRFCHNNPSLLLRLRRFYKSSFLFPLPSLPRSLRLPIEGYAFAFLHEGFLAFSSMRCLNGLLRSAGHFGFGSASLFLVANQGTLVSVPWKTAAAVSAPLVTWYKTIAYMNKSTF
jgi:hypothetical protein